MAASAATFHPSISRAGSVTRVPWTIWAGVLAVTCSCVGKAWDESWHRTIGRDAFLTPAHLAVYSCGVIAAIICGYLVFRTTFGHSQSMKDRSVTVLGFRAPLGAFIAAWGGIALLVSAPFDNWWHSAYGLDVKLISPPHTMSLLGIRFVMIGVVFLILAEMNRAAEAALDSATLRTLRVLFLYVCGLSLLDNMFFIQGYTWDTRLHSPTPYVALAMAVPVAFGIISLSSGLRWACTICAAIYMAFQIGEILILPLFPALPRLGPVYIPVTHFVPAKFPALIIVPAVVFDLLWHRLRSWKPWQLAAVSGVLFVAIMVAVEWPFASFLMSKASENRFFGTMYHNYEVPPTAADRMRVFIGKERPARMIASLLRASGYASISAWIGLSFGKWMTGVKR